MSANTNNNTSTGRSAKKAKTECAASTATLLRREANNFTVQHANLLQSLLDNSDIWVRHILPFVDPGYFLFVALICKKLKEYYLTYFLTIEEIPRVKLLDMHERGDHYALGSILNTYYRFAVATVACAEFWFNDTHLSGAL